MKKIFTLLILTAATGSIYAAPVAEGTAKTAAQNFLAQKYTPGIKVTLNSTYLNAEGEVAFYIFNIAESRGFVMVSGDDAVKPVLAYSTESNYSGENLSPEVAYWLNGYKQVISSVMAAHAVATTQVAAQWTKLLNPSAGGRTAARPTTVDPLLGAITWDQWPRYNNLSPISGASMSSTPTGCVATSMAQVMKYWNHPESGEGSHSYMHEVYGTQSADFEGTTYDWDNMPNALTASSTDAQIGAIATLMYHCGVAVEMQFGTGAEGGSGAYTINYGMSDLPCSQNALKDYFKYKSSIEGIRRDDYTDEEWLATMKEELDAARPILYSGQGDAGGHAWVLDGYDEDDYFHVNWGWSGSSNGYGTASTRW